MRLHPLTGVTPCPAGASVTPILWQPPLSLFSARLANLQDIHYLDTLHNAELFGACGLTRSSKELSIKPTGSASLACHDSSLVSSQHGRGGISLLTTVAFIPRRDKAGSAS